MDRVTGEYRCYAGAELTGQDLSLPRILGDDTERDVVPGDLNGLCPACVLEVDTALAHVPRDVRELSTLLPRALTGSSAERGEIMRPAPGPLLPLLERVYALQELVVHETVTWAEIVAGSAGRDWDTQMARRMRVPLRVETACGVLRRHLGVMLGLPGQEYAAQSLSEDPADGHDPDVATRRGRLTWTRRDGVEAGLVVLSLHRAALVLGAHVGRPDHLQMPCRVRTCHQVALRHWPGDDEVWCGVCGHRSRWEDYDILRSHLIAG